MEKLNKIVESATETIETIFKNIYKIPVFQRPYKWGKEEIEEFIDDLEESMTHNKYWFAGTLYIKQKKMINSSLYEYDIIDGQQRMTTLALILIAMQTLLAKQNTGSNIIQDINDNLIKESHFLLQNEGIEKNIFKYIFENAYISPSKLLENLEIYHVKNKIELEFKDKFLFIYNKICELNERKNIEYIYTFVKEKIIFNTVTLSLPYQEMFEIFDSINSKGKALDEIDKIKSYIFRNLDEKDYNIYLNKWGELIEKTEDSLEDYVYIFMKAFIKYYKSTGIRYFRAFCNNELKEYYKTQNLSNALKNFVDDLYKYVDIYVDMRNAKPPYHHHKTEFYMQAIIHLKYVHPLPLIFRSLCENKYSHLEKEKTNKLIKHAFIFMFNFQTMNERDSKETQEFFAKLMAQLYRKPFDLEFILKQFSKALKDRGISKESLNRKIRDHIAFVDNATKEAFILLLFYEFSDDKGRIDYDKAIWMLQNKSIMHVEHILPVSSDKNGIFMYQRVEVDGISKLVLLPGNDFMINPNVFDGMEYDDFRREVLDKVANLQICWRKDNLDKSNKFVKLADYSCFSSYKQVLNRTDDLIERLSKTELFDI